MIKTSDLKCSVILGMWLKLLNIDQFLNFEFTKIVLLLKLLAYEAEVGI